jgi:hypothetical protein
MCWEILQIRAKRMSERRKRIWRNILEVWMVGKEYGIAREVESTDLSRVSDRLCEVPMVEAQKVQLVYTPTTQR